MSAPEIAVVVASHDRPLRLRWLLNALHEQTLPRGRWEVVVAHDSGPETESVLREHALAADGTLRHLSFPPGPGPAEKRNAAWRDARAPLIAFTDDDCRPPPEWLERLLTACRERPGAVVQGATRPDPDEAHLLRTAHARTQDVDPPTVAGQTCNIAYPRDLLDRLGGFDRTFDLPAGEDTDLLARARRAGADHVAAPQAVTYHAVEVGSLAETLRVAWRWQALALVFRRHPELRRHLVLGLFWKPRHAALALGLAAVPLALRGPAGALAAAVAWLPWAKQAAPAYGRRPRGVARSAAELPGRALADAVEMAAVARGAVRHRTPVL